jgi:hypothetical protein
MYLVRAKGEPNMRIVARLAIWVLSVLASLTLLNAAIFAVRGGGVLEALLYVLIGVGFIATALYLRSRSEG